MNQNTTEAPEYARTFVDGLKEAGVGLVTALPGVVAAACTQGKRRQHGKPDSVVGRDDQLGDGWTGRYGVAERPVLLRRPGNAGGGNGP